jgi:poly-beta-1,6-N-acetyl-D-glucosamine biosynthesis protein PgaD
MIPAATLLRSLPWPPLVAAARLPRWIALRDVILTLLAWIFLGWLLRDAIYLIYDFVRHPIFELTTALPPDLATLWERLRFFVIVSCAFVGGIALWAFVNRRRLAGKTKSPHPRVLSTAAHAARFGVEEMALAAARDFKITSVKYRDDGSFAGFECKR